MPQVFKVGPYWVYFWANENEPLEPVHVHVAEGAPTANGTKIWITKAGKCLLCNNASKIPEKVLRNIMRIIEARSTEVVEKWIGFFGEASYYCYKLLGPLDMYLSPQRKKRQKSFCYSCLQLGELLFDSFRILNELS